MNDFERARLIGSLKLVGSSDFGSNAERRETLEALYTAQASLETPIETMIRLSILHSSWAAALRIGDQAGWFKTLAEAHRSPVPVDQLAVQSNMDHELALRFLRHLAAMGTIKQVTENTFQSAPLGDALSRPPASSITLLLTELMWPGLLRMPKRFATYGYNLPKSPAEAPAAAEMTGGKQLFEWVKENPQYAACYMDLMTCGVEIRLPWTERYPTSLLLNTDTPDGVILVDVGGNRGEDLELFRAIHPEVEAAQPRLIVQDQEHVSAAAKAHPAIKTMVHDFFTEQPIKGARAYYLHAILHDWPDQDARRILGNLRPAMKSGYSRVLINDMVVPEVGAQSMQTAADIIMLSYHGGKERTEKDWKALIELSGLKIVKIWRRDGDMESLIEAELA